MKTTSSHMAFAAVTALICLVATLAPRLAFAQDPGGGVLLKDIKLPEYKGEKLQFILYGRRAESEDVRVSLRKVLIDLIRDDVDDFRDIKDYAALGLYPMGENFEDVKRFWIRNTHSRALLQTPSATYDRVSKLVRGDEIVHFRSPLMDIDGVGFDADYDKKRIHIRSDVEVILRNDIGNLKLDDEDKPTTRKVSEP